MKTSKNLFSFNASWKYCVVIFLCFTQNYASTQSNLISGAFFSNDSGEAINWSIGESITESVILDHSSLTQGFHQGLIERTNNDHGHFSGSLEVYPNPAEDWLTIEVSDNWLQAELLIYSVDGQRVYSGKLSSINQQIDLSDYTSGLYLVQLIKAGLSTQHLINIQKL